MAPVNADRLISFDTMTPPLSSPATAGEERGCAVVGDEERLPFGAGSLDLYASILTLHGLNDVAGALAQIRRALRPNGVFIGALFGGETLKELREAFALAEIECDGGLSPRVFPFADLRDVGNLLQRAGFAEPIVDVDTVTVHYSDPLKLLHDLRGMGETNVLIERRRTFLKRRTLSRMREIYVEKFGARDGRVPATFQILHLSGRARFEAQQQPFEDGQRMRLS
jgi:SAM-dependent methyltransferase